MLCVLFNTILTAMVAMDKAEESGIDINGRQTEHIKNVQVIILRKVTGSIFLFSNEKARRPAAHMSDL